MKEEGGRKQLLIINIHLQTNPERIGLEGYIYICLSQKEFSLKVY